MKLLIWLLVTRILRSRKVIVTTSCKKIKQKNWQKIVNAALKAKAWTFEAKAKATGAKAKAKAKTIKIGLEAPRGLASRTTSLQVTKATVNETQWWHVIIDVTNDVKLTSAISGNKNHHVTIDYIN